MSSRIIRADSTDSHKITPFRVDPEILNGASIAPVNFRVSSTPVVDVVPPAPTQSVTAADHSVEPEQDISVRLSQVEKEAYEKGFIEGQKAGTDIGEKMVAAQLESYAMSLEELNGLRREVLATSEREVVRLALEIGRKVIKREITIDEDIILTLVKVALKRVANHTLITIRLNPKDCSIIARYQSVRNQTDPLNDGVKLVEDALISRGSCVIETESGIVDARIEEQLREIDKGFFE